jgi:hypothetical protein
MRTAAYLAIIILPLYTVASLASEVKQAGEAKQSVDCRTIKDPDDRTNCLTNINLVMAHSNFHMHHLHHMMHKMHHMVHKMKKMAKRIE